MNALLKWSIMGVFVVALLVVVLLGPGRLYGLLNSRQLDGQVVNIQFLEPDDEGIVETYLIKLHGNGEEMHVFASSDNQWLMIKHNDWVRVRLYPSPPWSGRHGQWQNASLAAKLIPPKPAPANPKPIVQKRKTQGDEK